MVLIFIWVFNVSCKKEVRNSRASFFFGFENEIILYKGSEQASGHPLGFPSFHTHHGTTQHSQRQQGGSANTEQPHFQGQYPSEGPSSAGDDDM